MSFVASIVSVRIASIAIVIAIGQPGGSISLGLRLSIRRPGTEYSFNPEKINLPSDFLIHRN